MRMHAYLLTPNQDALAWKESRQGSDSSRNSACVDRISEVWISFTLNLTSAQKYGTEKLGALSRVLQSMA